MNNMLNYCQVYVVGGYVRDHLLGLTPNDVDFVVCGATPEQMLTWGFIHINATNFPVFLHPITGDEFALARTERKVNLGYHGFECVFDSNVTIEEDLMRRDITINSMAYQVLKFNSQGNAKINYELIDPFNGYEDLQNGIIRNTSIAFVEDPVRVLRICRFAARYNFLVADETIQLMKEIVQSGELNHLTAERVWLELEKTMMELYPVKFFELMDRVGALNVTMPELTDKWWRGIDNAVISGRRFMYLTVFLSEEEIESFYNRVKAPNHIKQLAIKFRKLHQWYDEIVNLKINVNVEQIFNLFTQLDVLRNSSEFIECVTAYRDTLATPLILDFIVSAQQIYCEVKFVDLENAESLKGKEIGEALQAERKKRLVDFLKCK